ncbi:Succinylglutamate desuccinylase / Aspartoacylase family protein [Halogranum rubrum]|uniref:Succinylglutamate desuccinylase / Aspartoacylase family protein n=1 Tax=Halogranum rubrum TaxID=553466 RepID=A0A1I4DZ26_9EURY|nr:succinylglutamate desuccinylase/aspartoacylase family protein [Halogranum rubrum]SFK98715.1 Succinylglutamate desuccinylase / Aspartoacylase family protein [Halogranum rubrum]
MPENPSTDDPATTSRRGFLKAAATLSLAGSAVSATSQQVAAASRDSYTILDGTIYETSVHVYDSGNDGPTTFITGGIHGDERSGFMAAEEIATWTVDHGKLVVIPRANVPAIDALDRHGPEGDLNRQFPPRSGECYTDIARAIWEEVVRHDPDFAFDLHSARGIWRSGDGSVGQAVFPTWTSPARDYGENAIADLNDEFGLTGDMAYLMGNTLDADRKMLMHRIAGYLDVPGFLCETTEKADSLEEQIQWHLFTVDHIMNQYGQSPNADGSKSDSSNSSSSDEPSESELHIEGTGPVVRFEFSVSGGVENAGTLEDSDTVYDSRVTGQVSSQDDRYAFTGDLEHFTVTEGDKEDVNVYLDGEQISVDQETDEREVHIEGTGPVVRFEFAVSGDVENAGTLEDSDTVYDSRVTGQVSSQDDRYAFTGELEHFTVTEGDKEDVNVYLDGEQISVDQETDEREIHIEGTGPVVRFEFSVSGGVENAGTLEDSDTVYDSRVEGQVSSQDDRYAFTGDLEHFTVTEGDKEDVNVYLDGEQISVREENPEKILHIGGTGPVTRFEFSVSGDLRNTGTLEDSDTVYDSRVEGQVSSQDDEFAYTGELEHFTVTYGNKEDVVVTVDGDRISVQEETPEKILHIGGTGPVTRFEFSVSGDLRNTGTLEDSDTVYDSRVEGQVSSQDDEFAYTGELEHFTVTHGRASDVDVTVDGEQISVEEETHLIEIRGTGPVVRFEFAVSGDLRNAGTLEDSDTLYDHSVDGQVSSQDDAFEYTGELEHFDVTYGSADDIVVVVDGSEMNVA